MKNTLILCLAILLYSLFELITSYSGSSSYVQNSKKTIYKPVKKGKQIIVGVIDTGFGWKNKGSPNHLCSKGHKDDSTVNDYTTKFQTSDPVPVDNHGHGTNVIGLIEDNAKEADYCIVVVKFYDPRLAGNLDNEIKALNDLIALKPDIINLSLGGVDTNGQESEIIKKYLDQGGIVVAAAGNERQELGKDGHGYYPAMSDDRVIVVGNLGYSGKINPSSNYGKRVNTWEIGENAESYGIVLTGTSQATAIHTGKLIYNLYKNK